MEERTLTRRDALRLLGLTAAATTLRPGLRSRM